MLSGESPYFRQQIRKLFIFSFIDVARNFNCDGLPTEQGCVHRFEQLFHTQHYPYLISIDETNIGS